MCVLCLCIRHIIDTPLSRWQLMAISIHLCKELSKYQVWIKACISTREEDSLVVLLRIKRKLMNIDCHRLKSRAAMTARWGLIHLLHSPLYITILHSLQHPLPHHHLTPPLYFSWSSWWTKMTMLRTTSSLNKMATSLPPAPTYTRTIPPPQPPLHNHPPLFTAHFSSSPPHPFSLCSWSYLVS